LVFPEDLIKSKYKIHLLELLAFSRFWRLKCVSCKSEKFKNRKSKEYLAKQRA